MEGMESYTDTRSLFAAYRMPEKKKASERGELLRYFSEKLSRPIPRVAMYVKGLEVKDLYFMKSDCDQAEARGVPWGAAFHTSLKVR